MVFPSARGCRAGGLALFLLAALTSGCGPPAAAPVPVPVVEEIDEGPCEIELSEPKVTLVEPTLVRFEVKYRFTKGKPSRFYACDVSFPGTANHGVKRMQHWELKTEGVIKDGVVLSMGPVTSFTIHMSEAPTGRDAYQRISNVVSGLIP